MRETVAISFRAIESVGRGLVWKSSFQFKVYFDFAFFFSKIESHLILKVFLVRKILLIRLGHSATADAEAIK